MDSDIHKINIIKIIVRTIYLTGLTSFILMMPAIVFGKIINFESIFLQIIFYVATVILFIMFGVWFSRGKHILNFDESDAVWPQHENSWDREKVFKVFIFLFILLMPAMTGVWVFYIFKLDIKLTYVLIGILLPYNIILQPHQYVADLFNKHRL